MNKWNNAYFYNEVDKETQEFFNKHESLVAQFPADPFRLDNSDDIDDVLDNTLMPWLKLPIDVPWKDIYKEAKHLLDTECFTLHRANTGGGWLSLCIHGMSSTHTNVPEDYKLPDSAERELSTWTDIAKFCPATVEWMKSSMPYTEFTRVRFMALLPGGWIAPHQDTTNVPGFGATNVAINNPDGCALVMEDWGTMPFEPGTAFKISPIQKSPMICLTASMSPSPASFIASTSTNILRNTAVNMRAM